MSYRGQGKRGSGGVLFKTYVEICYFRYFLYLCMCVCMCAKWRQKSCNKDSAPTRHVKQPNKDIFHQVGHPLPEIGYILLSHWPKATCRHPTHTNMTGYCQRELLVIF